MNIINFPLRQRIEPPHAELPEINIEELDDYYEAMYSPPRNYISRDRCYRCGHVFTKDNHVWNINQMGGYPSRFDGSLVDIEICDDCMCHIFSNKITFDKDI